MKKTDFLSLTTLIMAAAFCISGQSARKEVPVASQVECSVSPCEPSKEKPISQRSAHRKSAAKRSMEPDSQTSMNLKSAAKRSME